METNRELLELAAKAEGIKLLFDPYGVPRDCTGMDPLMNIFAGKPWNPLTDDGDAFRLAVKLKMLVDCHSQCARPLPDSIEWQEGSGPDDYANTRLAIVRAAAEIGKAMP